MTGHVDAKFYAQVEPEWSSWQLDSEGNKILNGAKVVTVTQKKPVKPKGGTVLVKLTIRVPASAFMPLRPEAIVVIPETMAVTQPIEVVAEDPA